MKRIIIAIDGMDYSHSIKLNLVNVLQEKCKQINVPIHPDYKIPMSPHVWSSFLCGKDVLNNFNVQKNNKLLKPFAIMKRIFPFISIGFGEKFFGGNVNFGELKTESFVNNDKVYEVNFPFFSYDNEPLKAFNEFRVSGNYDKCFNRMCKIYEIKTRLIYKELINFFNQEEKILFLGYIHFPDSFYHLLFTSKIFEIYYLDKVIDGFCGRISEICDENELYFISDHAFDFEKGLHKQGGLLSCNKKIKLPNSIIDFGKQQFDYLGRDV